MNDNIKYSFQELEEIQPGIFTMFCLIDTGIILGTFNSNLNFIKANTFLPNDMLSGNQLERQKEILSVVDKYKFTTGTLN